MTYQKVRMMQSKLQLSLITLVILFRVPVFALAEEYKSVDRDALASVYARRTDLRLLFRTSDWKAISSSKTVGIPTLEEWARKYGYKEHPELAAFGPARVVPALVPSASTSSLELRSDLPPALTPLKDAPHPVQTIAGTFDFKKITAERVLVVDPASRRILLEKGVGEQHHLASITKLMTALLVTKKGLPMKNVETILLEDEIGGARLRVANGIPLTVHDIFYAMIVGSANNAAHALARLTSESVPDFVKEMNTQAKALGLSSTVFVDPSGLDVGNMSSARDIAALAITAFDDQVIRRAATTANYSLIADGQIRQLKNTNGLLTDPNNGLYVLGGKTGYLEESKWNLVVKMRDDRNKPLLIVVLGSASQADSFKDSTTIAKWTWEHYQLQK